MNEDGRRKIDEIIICVSRSLAAGITSGFVVGEHRSKPDHRVDLSRWPTLRSFIGGISVAA